MFECDLAHRRSVAVLCMLYKIMCNPDTHSLWCSTWSVRDGACYTRCCDRTSVLLGASSLQNLAVPEDFYSPVSVSMEQSWWPMIRWCGTGGFQEQGQCIFLFAPFLSPSDFHFSFFVLFVGIGGWDLRTDRVFYNRSRPALHCQPFSIIIIIKITTLT